MKSFNQEVEKTFQHFYNKSNADDILRNTSSKNINPKKVANYWYQFSCFMPGLLIDLSSKTIDKLKRKSLREIAFEELGLGHNETHFEMFENAMSFDLNKNVMPYSISLLSNYASENELNDFKIMGLGLGLEIIANENINNLLMTTMANGDNLKTQKEKAFFKIHLVNEDEHIRKNIKNYLDFCELESEKEQFLDGFNVGIHFWHSFWGECYE